MFNLEGMASVVTGSSRGIERAIADGFASQGHEPLCRSDDRHQRRLRPRRTIAAPANIPSIQELTPVLQPQWRLSGASISYV